MFEPEVIHQDTKQPKVELYHDEKGIKNQKIARRLKKQGLTVREICEKMNLGNTSVRNYLQDDFKPFVTSAKYMSDLDRDKKWFLNI